LGSKHIACAAEGKFAHARTASAAHIRFVFMAGSFLGEEVRDKRDTIT
jgi:hypothetical protein